MGTEEGKRGTPGHGMSMEVIYIIGPRRMQNELLAFFLEQKIGATCLTGADLSIFHGEDNTETDPFPVVLIDCYEKGLESVFAEIDSSDKDIVSRAHVALINVDPDLNIEEDAVLRGIKGFFYELGSPEPLLKGVRVISEGEFWVSRAILSKCIVKQKSQGRVSGGGTSGLTARETEILAMVAVGVKNEEIADKLCISPHTVKTHIYNIFKKIGVPNRLQAALWAAKNL
jgi:LuxR family transcriptional regulator of csgAB operon